MRTLIPRRRSRKRLIIFGIPIALAAFVALYALAGFVLLPYFSQPYLPGYLHDRLGLSARVGHVAFNPFSFRLEARDLALLDPNQQPVATVGRLLADFEFKSLFTRAWTVHNAEIDAADVHLDVLPDGRLNLLTHLKPEAESPEKSARAHRRLTWQTIAVKNSKLHVVHRGYTPPLAYGFAISRATVNNVAPASAQPIAFAAEIQVTEGGAVAASGEIAQDFRTAQGQVNIARVALQPLQPLLSKYATLVITSGEASAQAQLHYARDSKPNVRMNGALSIDRVVLKESNGDPFLAWNKLSTESFALALAPGSFRVPDVSWDRPEAKIEISRDRKINLARVTKHRDVEEAARSTFDMQVDWVHMRDGTLDFADYSLVLPFATKVVRFNGAVAGISSKTDARADLKLEGLIEHSGAAKADGTVNVFDPSAYTDIRVAFDNVRMPTLTPYTATFAGRKIASGRLWLDLNYHIVQGKLNAENKLVMEQLRLGERVAAPTALDLPLDLAVALLSDSKGRISLAIPLSGDVNHPNFHYAKLLTDAVAAALKHVVTAPFRALASALGWTKQGMDTIEFEPGRARLLPASRDKLDRVAQPLRNRQQLKLIVQAAYDPNLDGHALREEAVRRELAKAVGRNLARTNDPAPISYTDASTQRALERMMTQYAGEPAKQQLVNEFTQRAGRSPQRVNPVLAFVGRGSEDREFYEAMFNQLVRTYPLPDAAPKELAQRRAECIIDYLARTGQVEIARLEVGDTRAVKDRQGQSVAAKLTLDDSHRDRSS